MTEKTATRNPFVWMVHYLKEAKEELGKVTWPTQKDVIFYSVLVIVVSVLLGAFFTGADWIFNLGLEKLVAFTY